MMLRSFVLLILLSLFFIGESRSLQTGRKNVETVSPKGRHQVGPESPDITHTGERDKEQKTAHSSHQKAPLARNKVRFRVRQTAHHYRGDQFNSKTAFFFHLGDRYPA